ncbi:hypothetical protein [Velocimicrobium porci]|uniref:Uncharacterized protein n=1 Tax=Velocimicrobium porci TaxID=2606634 RepID=A0A6L5XUY9_9FIRM|nr:hypothetical protein [Velocimicrobium porci]MSS62626.1 hypothetical protein [Velocimicrobium porci]
MKKSYRILVFLMITFLFFEITFSYLYIAENLYHDCSGENCPICMHIDEASQFISSIKLIPILSLFLAMLCVFTLIYTIYNNEFCVKHTLITLKVELLD